MNKSLLFGSLLKKCQPLNHRFISCTASKCDATGGQTSSVKKTALYDLHIERKGKVVDFAGYLLPVQYADLGISASHLHTRNSASIFDVSHMLQTYVRGNDAIECFESICTADIKGLKYNSGTLTVFTNESGGIFDDLIVSKINDDLLYVVSNAACRTQDIGIINEAIDRYRQLGKDVSAEFLDAEDRSLIALQGPQAIKALETISGVELGNLYFMQTTVLDSIAGVQGCRVTRCGYTGEDGVEISVPSERAAFIVEALLDCKVVDVKLAGLGARDSLRLEAGLCLYGSDIDQTTSPIEAGLAWLVAKRRRTEANFPGANTILNHLKNGCTRRRVGIRLEKGPPARHGVHILANNQVIGEVTSGCPSPSLGGNVAMGYVKNDFKAVGTDVELKIRDKTFAAKIAKMPFTPAHYHHEKKK